MEEQDEVKKFQSKLSKTINSLEEEKKKSEKVRNMLIKLLVNIDINQLIQLFYGNVTAESLENLGGIHKSGYLMKQGIFNFYFFFDKFSFVEINKLNSILVQLPRSKSEKLESSVFYTQRCIFLLF